MAEFKSHYKELGFYVNGEYKSFSEGRFVTENDADIAVLESIHDVIRVDEPKAPAPKAASKKK